jgi:hypothetical protein
VLGNYERHSYTSAGIENLTATADAEWSAHAGIFLWTAGCGAMIKLLAVIQIVIVVGIIVYMTVQFFMGNFEQAFAAFPILLLYYVFIVARQNRPR